MNALDRAIGYVSPEWALRRQAARTRQALLARHYEGAAGGRRTSGWTSPATDANASMEGQLERLRNVSRDLVRNDPFARSAVDTIANHVVGWGISAKPMDPAPRVLEAWKSWADVTTCDADGRYDFAGIQKLVIRTIVRDGEVLVRRRLRLPQDGLPVPLQVQVLEVDYLDTTKHNITTPNGGRILYGIEYDGIGRRVAYWMFREHPGSNIFWNAQASVRVPADGVCHVFLADRAGQVRGVPWLAPVILALKDFNEYADAQLMKQKIAALLAGVVTDSTGSGGTIVGNNETGSDFPVLYPGALVQAPPGTEVKFTAPPTVAEYEPFARTTLRSVATGLGVTYEDLSGDYSQVNFSSARMSRLAHYDKVYDWRWMMMVPQLCDPIWSWVMEAAAIMSMVPEKRPRARWTAPPIPMIEPDKEGRAYQQNIRSGIMTLSEAIRERGYDPKELLEEMAADNETLDELEIVLDSDPRKMTQAGQAQADPNKEAPTPSAAANAADPGEDPEADPAPAEGDAAPQDGGRGLTPRQLAIVQAIRDVRGATGEAPSVSLLARKLGIDRKTLRGHLETMCDRGVLRTPSPAGLPA